jgi:6-phosphogluconate dehydrogenase
MKAGHDCVVYNPSAQAVAQLVGAGAVGAATPADLAPPAEGAALNARFASRGEADFQNKLLSAMRWQFGGHQEKT